MKFAVRISLAGEIQSPDEVVRNRFWLGVFEVAVQGLDFVIVPLQGTTVTRARFCHDAKLQVCDASMRASYPAIATGSICRIAYIFRVSRR